MGRYLVAASAARLADAMWVGPVLLVLDRTGSPALAGLTLSAATLPTLVSAPLIGAWLDVHGRRRAAIALNQALLAGALLALPLVPPAALVPCAAVAGLLQPLVTGGFSSMVPALAGRHEAGRARAAGLDAMTYGVASVAGPGLAGLTAAVAAPPAAVLAQAAIALAGLAAVLALPRGADGRPGAGRLVRTLRRGLGHLARTARLRAVTIITVLEQLAAGLMTVAAPALAVAVGAHAAAGGLVLAALALGAAAGAPLLGRVRRGRLATVALATLAEAGGLALLGLAPSLAVTLVAAVVAGVPQGLAAAALFAARAEWSPPDLRAQVFTSAAGLRTATFAVGAALAGPALSAGAWGAIEWAAVACAAAVAAGLSAGPGAGSRSPAGTSAG